MNTINRLIQLSKIMILARLLPPKEFGLLGIGFLTLAIFEGFSQLGFDLALIQNKDKNVDMYLDTSWVLKVLRGLLLTCTIFLIAPYAASWFGEPRATNVIRVLGIGPLLLGLKNPGVVYFRKSLKFHLRFLQTLSGTIMNFFIAVSLGILLGNVWALVAGSVIGNITSVFVSYLLHDYRPRPRFKLGLAQELVGFGKWVFGSSITRFFRRQGDDIFVGWFFGATPLAFYQMAYRFAAAPSTELVDIINNVAFPSFSQVQDDYQKLRNGYLRTLRFTGFLSLPAAFGIALVAPSFVRVFLGTEWLPTVPLMQALAVWGGLRAISSINGPVMYTLSRPDIGFKFSVVRVLLIGIGIYPAAVQFGIFGVAALIVITGAIVSPIVTLLTLKLIDLSVLRYLQTIMHPLIGCVFMTGTLLLIGNMITFELAIIELISFILVGSFTYILYSVSAVAFFNYQINDDFRTVLDSFK